MPPVFKKIAETRAHSFSTELTDVLDRNKAQINKGIRQIKKVSLKDMPFYAKKYIAQLEPLFSTIGPIQLEPCDLLNIAQHLYANQNQDYVDNPKGKEYANVYTNYALCKLILSKYLTQEPEVQNILTTTNETLLALQEKDSQFYKHILTTNAKDIIHTPLETITANIKLLQNYNTGINDPFIDHASESWRTPLSGLLMMYEDF